MTRRQRGKQPRSREREKCPPGVKLRKASGREGASVSASVSADQGLAIVQSL